MELDEVQSRSRHMKRFLALKTERSSWDQSWLEIGEYIHPRRTRFFTSDRNRGTKKGTKIINNTATLAANTCAAGMHEGITSPAQKWFRLSTPDPEMAETGTARSWLHIAEERTYQHLARTNIYKCLPLMYTDIATMGTTVAILEEDFDKVFYASVLPIGSYCLACDELGKVDTLYRDVSMTVRQMVKKFGEEKCSTQVQNLYKQGQVDVWQSIVHVIEPNEDYQAGKFGVAGKKWKSCWFESAPDSTQGYLKEGGYARFPVLAPRWAVTSSEDVYGTSPGMEAIGDAKALQLYERRKAQIIDKITDPPMRGPASLRNQRVSLAPGAITYVDSMRPGDMFEPAYQINPAAIESMELAIRPTENRIKVTFKEDIFKQLTLSSMEGPQKTAREIAELHEEKMLQLGPVFGQVNDELLEPLITYTILGLLERKLIPPPPPELQGQDLKIEYLSVVAAAQKLLASAGVREITTFTLNLSAVVPEAKDKLNIDQIVDEMAQNLGVKPELLHTDEEVAQMRAERAKAQQAAAQAEQAQSMAEGAKTLSGADMSGDNALTQLAAAIPGAAGGGALQ